jgi:hypothetical protein
MIDGHGNAAVQALLQLQNAESYKQEGLPWSDMCMLHGMPASSVIIIFF